MLSVDWRSYLDADWGVTLVDEAPAWREYRLDNPSGPLVCRSMLMRYEFAMLYALAKDHYRGEGAIVDAGPLTGISSNVLARGLLANPRVPDRKRRIFAFDLFDHFPNDTLKNVSNRNGSLLDTYIDVNRDYLDLISVCPGDVSTHAWNSGPIEILMLDLAKSWSLNSFAVDQWFPEVPVGGFIVQQDYCSWFTYWLPITMMALKDHFEFVDCAMGSSTIFRCIKPVPAGLGEQVRNLGFDKHEALLSEAVEAAPVSAKPVLTCVKAMFYAAHQEQERALELLGAVSTERLSGDDWATDFSGLASGSRDTVKFLADLPGQELAKYDVHPARPLDRRLRSRINALVDRISRRVDRRAPGAFGAHSQGRR